MIKKIWILIIISLFGCNNNKILNTHSDLLFNSNNPKNLEKNCSLIEENINQEIDYLKFNYTTKVSTDFLNKLDGIFLKLGNSFSVAQLFSNVHPEAEFRLKASDCQQKFQQLFTDISLSVSKPGRTKSITKSSPDIKLS